MRNLDAVGLLVSLILTAGFDLEMNDEMTGVRVCGVCGCVWVYINIYMYAAYKTKVELAVMPCMTDVVFNSLLSIVSPHFFSHE